MKSTSNDTSPIGGAPSMRDPIASNRHLIVFAGACAIFASIGVYTQSYGPAPNPGDRNIVPLYVSTMIGEWALLFFVWRGVRKEGFNLFALSPRWPTPAAAAVDLGIGVGLGLLLVALDTFVQHLLGSDPARSVQHLLPVSPIEVTLWIGVSVTAGIVEELVFRGYLMRQLASRLHNVPLAVIAQALWFAAMHAYEGAQSVVSICALGLLLGAAAVWCKQLRTNIIAHSVIDLIEGLAPKLIRF